MDVLRPKRGDRFLHAQWLGEDNKPLPCIVTQRRGEMVFFRGTYPDGKAGGCMCTDLADFPKRVKQED